MGYTWNLLTTAKVVATQAGALERTTVIRLRIVFGARFDIGIERRAVALFTFDVDLVIAASGFGFRDACTEIEFAFCIASHLTRNVIAPIRAIVFVVEELRRVAPFVVFQNVVTANGTSRNARRRVDRTFIGALEQACLICRIAVIDACTNAKHELVAIAIFVIV